jgi:hypothetical protein
MGPGRSKSCPAKVGHQPEASLAWAIPQGRLRSVDSEVGGRVNEPRKALVVGVVHVVSRATALLCRNGLARGARPGSESTAYGYRGPSRNLGDPVISAEGSAGEGPGLPKIQACGRGRPQPARAKSGGRTGGTAGTRGTESGRTNGGKSESLIVPLKPGNRPVGPGGGKGAPWHGTERRERCRDRRISGASQRDFVG